MQVSVNRIGDFGPIGKEIERDLRNAQVAAGRAVAKVARKELLDDVRSSRGHLRMMGGRLGVKVELDANTTSSLVTLSGSPAGPWSIVEFGTKAYDIKPKRKQVLAIATGDVIGTKAHRQRRAGKRYWDAATSRRRWSHPGSPASA